MASEWSVRRIGDFAVRKKVINERGDDLPPLSVTKDRGVVLQSEKYNKRVATDPKKYVVVEEGDFAFDPMGLYYGTLGRVAGIRHGLISPDYVAFNVDSSVDPEFIEYLLRSPPMIQKYGVVAQAGNQFGKRRRVYWSVLCEVTISAPPLSQQRRIAAILSSVDETIRQMEAVIAQLGVVKKALLGELLTRGIPGRHKAFKETSEGRLPANWELRRLEELAEVRTGLAKNSKNAVGHVVELPYLRVANVQDGYLDLAEVKTIEVDAAKVERYSLRDGDVLFNEGGDADKVGRGTVWRSEIPRCLHQNHVFAVRPSSVIIPDFLSMLGGSARGKEYFLDAAKQTTNLASINSTQLRAMPVPLPSLSEQAEIVSLVQSVQERIVSEQRVLFTVRQVKAGLLDALLSGRVRVPISPQEAA